MEKELRLQGLRQRTEVQVGAGAGENLDGEGAEVAGAETEVQVGAGAEEMEGALSWMQILFTSDLIQGVCFGPVGLGWKTQVQPPALRRPRRERRRPKKFLQD